MTWASNGAARFRCTAYRMPQTRPHGRSRRHQAQFRSTAWTSVYVATPGTRPSWRCTDQPELEFLRDRHRDECDEDVAASVTGGDRVAGLVHDR